MKELDNFLNSLSDEFGKKKSFKECLQKLEEEMVEMSEEYKVKGDNVEFNENFKIELLDVLQSAYSTLISMSEEGKIKTIDIIDWNKKQKQRKEKYLRGL